MGHYIREYWLSEGDGMTRRDRRGCEYAAYVPDPIAGATFTFDGETAADVSDAELAIIRLNAQSTSLASTEAIARLLLRAEAVASSWIEGLEVGAGRVLRAEAAREFEDRGRADVTAEEVLGNIDAMSEALAAADTESEITVETILEIHRRLLAPTRLAEHAGRIREVQNWVGGSAYNPCSAAFIPPPPSEVLALLEDLAAFCNEDLLSPVAQAAIAHAQFETIHPFVDGNGRTGRALIHLILRRRGLAPRVVPPVSLVLATLSRDYIEGLTAFRYEGIPGSDAAIDGVNRWVALFGAACARAVRDAEEFEERVDALKYAWRSRLGKVRSGSSANLMVELLPGTPMVTATSAAKLLGRTFKATNRAIALLQEKGVLRQVTVGRRNKAFEATEAIAAFTSLERQLASPADNTLSSPPTRPVPARRQGEGA